MHVITTVSLAYTNVVGRTDVDNNYFNVCLYSDTVFLSLCDITTIVLAVVFSFRLH